MAYDHKKSLRTLTDEQFSDGTTVDGSRIDDALGESVEHFNSIPEGDVSTRFTKTQYIFGYQPACFTGTPNNSAGGGASMRFNATNGTVEGTTFPWNFITNNRNTSAQVGPTDYGKASTPTAGFQNKWRIKGTNYSPIPASGVQEVSNEGGWGSAPWEDDWADTSGNPTASQRQAASNYQFAWSHSWVFDSPVIFDSVCVFLRTDAPIDLVLPPSNTFGYYDAPFEYVDAAGDTHQTNCVSLHLSVDNEFAKEERDLNDVEFIFQDRWLDGYKVNPFMTGQAVAYNDMLPNSPEYDTVGSTGKGLHGRLIRFRDLNIPIRKGARVRLSIVVPWFEKATATANSDSQGLRTDSLQYKYMDWSAVNRPLGREPMYGFSVNGSINVLEPVGY